MYISKSELYEGNVLMEFSRNEKKLYHKAITNSDEMLWGLKNLSFIPAIPHKYFKNK